MNDEVQELREDIREILEPLDSDGATRLQLLEGVRLVLAMLDADEDAEEDEEDEEDEDEEGAELEEGEEEEEEEEIQGAD